MRFIRKSSYKYAKSLAQQLNENHERKRLYYYGFQIVIGGIVKFAFLVLLALLTGTLKETFTVLAFFAGLRVVGGGYHMDDYTNCMITSFAMFIGLGLLVKYTADAWDLAALAVLSAIAFGLAIFSVLRYAPADTPFKPMNNPAQNKRLKMLSLIETILWVILDFILLLCGYKLPVLAGCFGMLAAAFIISPVGYAFFNLVSGRMHKLKKRRVLRLSKN